MYEPEHELRFFYTGEETDDCEWDSFATLPPDEDFACGNPGVWELKDGQNSVGTFCVDHKDEIKLLQGME